MASNDLQSLREELLAKEKELSGMHQLLIEQDDDLRACQSRMGDLESTLLVAFKGDDALCGQDPTSPPLHPTRRTLYDDTIAVGEEDADEGADSPPAFASVSRVDSSLPAEEPHEGCSASALLPRAAGNPPPKMLPRPHDESTQGWAAVKSPPYRAGTLSDTSESSQHLGDPKPEWVARLPEPTARSAPVEVGNTVVGNAVGIIPTASPRDVDVAPEPRSVPVTSPSVFPSRPAGVAVSAVCSGGPAVNLPASLPARSSDTSSSGRERSTKSPECQNKATSTPPERPDAGRSRASGGWKEGPVIGFDSYGRCRDRSFQARQELREGPERKGERDLFPDTVSASSGGGQSASELGDQQIGGDDGVDRLTRAERRAGTAEAAERAIAARMLSVVREATVAKDETERLRAEVLELSRWREAVLDLRDVLNVSQEQNRGRGSNPEKEEDTIDDDPVARHAQWVSSSALETLLPHLHLSARELLADLAAARKRSGTRSDPAIEEDATRLDAERLAGGKCGTSARTEESGEREHAEERSCNGGRSDIRECRPQGGRERREQQLSCLTRTASSDEGREGGQESREVGTLAVSPATGSAVSGAGGYEADEDQSLSLRKSCETLRIMVDALRDKDEDSQKRIFALEQQVFDASLAALKQESLVATLQRKLESRNPKAPSARDLKATGAVCLERGNGFSPRRKQSGQPSRLRNEVSLSPGQTSPRASTLRQTPRTNQADRTTSPGGAACCRCGGSGPAAATPTAGSSPRRPHENEDKARTPTTDILRRLLYENTPLSSSPRASEPDGRVEVGGSDTGGARERSRHGRRLFAEGSTVLRACPTAGCDVAGVRRGPVALFSDSACGTGGEGCEAGSSRCVAAEDDKVEKEDKMSRVGGSLESRTEEATGNARPRERGASRAPAGEVVLRERLVRARRDFSALHTGNPSEGEA